MLTFEKQTFKFLRDKVYPGWNDLVAKGASLDKTQEEMNKKMARLQKKVSQTLARLNLGSLSDDSSDVEGGKDGKSDIKESEKTDSNIDELSKEESSTSKRLKEENGSKETGSKKSKSKSSRLKSRSKLTVMNSKSVSKNIISPKSGVLSSNDSHSHAAMSNT